MRWSKNIKTMMHIAKNYIKLDKIPKAEEVLRVKSKGKGKTDAPGQQKKEKKSSKK